MKSVANGCSGSNHLSCHETCAACEHEMLGYQLDLCIRPDNVVCSLVTCLQCFLVSFHIRHSVHVLRQFSLIMLYLVVSMLHLYDACLQVCALCLHECKVCCLPCSKLIMLCALLPAMLKINHAVCAVQYLELAYEVYAGWYCYAAVLYFISVVSCFLGVRALYLKRLELFKSIQQQHIMPVVSKGLVRQVHSVLCSAQCSATCMQAHKCHLPN